MASIDVGASVTTVASIVGAVPIVNLASQVNGILPVVNGGTGIGSSSLVVSSYGVTCIGTVAPTYDLVSFGAAANIDTHAAYAGGVVTCPLPGLYEMSVRLENDYTSGLAKTGSLQLFRNATALATETCLVTAAQTRSMVNGNMIVACSTGHTLSVKYQHDGTSPTWVAAAATFNVRWIRP